MFGFLRLVLRAGPSRLMFLCGAGLIRGFCHSGVLSDVDLPGKLSVGPVVGVTTACAGDKCDAVRLFVSLCWVGGCPLNGPKVPLPLCVLGSV